MRDLEIFPEGAGSASTIGLRMRGNGGAVPAKFAISLAVARLGNVIKSSVQIDDVPRGFVLTDANITAYIVGPGALGREEI